MKSSVTGKVFSSGTPTSREPSFNSKVACNCTTSCLSRSAPATGSVRPAISSMARTSVIFSLGSGRIVFITKLDGGGRKMFREI